MKNKLISLFAVFILLCSLIPLELANAHPGRTDANGGHTCRTNCAKWGLKTGEYHYHNSDGSIKKETIKTTVKEKTKKDTKTEKSITSPTGLVLPKLQPAGTLQVYYLDVAQGDSTLIRTPKGQYILIDGGNNNQGKNVVKYLKGLGVKKLDVMIATHPDADHIGGLDDALKAFDVQVIYAPKVSHTTDTFKDFLTAVKTEGRTIKTAKAGVSLTIDGVDASFLAPVNDYADDLNAWSAVLKITYKDTSFLFTGDAESKSENDMLADGVDLKADVLKVGHHGSKTSTSKAFIDAVKPNYAIISVGKNSYGHPDSGILGRLNNVNAVTYRTDKQGTITAISDGSKITFVTTKK
ncbi:MBL fold metallo-hydrolase [Paenibacillus segetis]|uniref:MBL fold hydrolase n=1 Tax=Paenibacillus segetis TaxID=1325360 RepID=A0ABQ1YAC4_9BACL|nr:MBL fold metallo-hydrolase [Paenibacillus segetis]GGH17474.1 MBL fold hydrolase [Paenibacillus segetis]